jgi:hypothetical protein
MGTVLLASLALYGHRLGPVLRGLHEAFESFGAALDLPYSPVRLMVQTLPADIDPQVMGQIRAAVALAYAVSIVMVVAFATAIRYCNWPGRSGFNVWVNLPQFDPTTGGDVVERLQRDAHVNLVLGLLLPLIAPLAANILSVPFQGTSLTEPAALVWMVVAWAFIPANLVMRGLAFNRLAWLIAAHRARLRRAEVLAHAA